MEAIQQFWTNVNEIFEFITPTIEPVKKVQEKIPFPIRYILMAFVALLFLVFYLLTRKSCFFELCSFFCGLICCTISLAAKENNEQKWMAFWILFSFGEMLPACLNANIYFSIIKCLTLIYFAVYSDCSIIMNALKVCFSATVRCFELYMQKFCPQDDKDKQN